MSGVNFISAEKLDNIRSLKYLGQGNSGMIFKITYGDNTSQILKCMIVVPENVMDDRTYMHTLQYGASISPVCVEEYLQEIRNFHKVSECAATGELDVVNLLDYFLLPYTKAPEYNDLYLSMLDKLSTKVEQITDSDDETKIMWNKLLSNDPEDLLSSNIYIGFIIIDQLENKEVFHVLNDYKKERTNLDKEKRALVRKYPMTQADDEEVQKIDERIQTITEKIQEVQNDARHLLMKLHRCNLNHSDFHFGNFLYSRKPEEINNPNAPRYVYLIDYGRLYEYNSHMKDYVFRKMREIEDRDLNEEDKLVKEKEILEDIQKLINPNYLYCFTFQGYNWLSDYNTNLYNKVNVCSDLPNNNSTRLECMACMAKCVKDDYKQYRNREFTQELDDDDTIESIYEYLIKGGTQKIFTGGRQTLERMNESVQPLERIPSTKDPPNKYERNDTNRTIEKVRASLEEQARKKMKAAAIENFESNMKYLQNFYDEDKEGDGRPKERLMSILDQIQIVKKLNQKGGKGKARRKTKKKMSKKKKAKPQRKTRKMKSTNIRKNRQGTRKYKLKLQKQK